MTTETVRRKRGRPSRCTRDEVLALMTRRQGSAASAAKEVGMRPKNICRRLHAGDLPDRVRELAELSAAQERAHVRAAQRDAARAKFRVAFVAGNLRAMRAATIALVALDDGPLGWDRVGRDHARTLGRTIAHTMAPLAEVERARVTSVT
jgi:hypothetical protein